MPIKFGTNLTGGDLDPVRATQDATVTQVIEHGVEIQRKVFAGELVPPDLVESYRVHTGEAEAPEKAERGPAAARDEDAVAQDPQSGETAPKTRRRS